MVIDERLDIVVWSATLLVFLLMGARAWAVETAKSRNYRTSARARVLTGSVWVSLVALVGVLAMQGGIALVQGIVTGTEPEDFVTVVDTDGNAEGPDDQNDPPADPAAPPADPNAPPGDPNAPPGDPNAPPAGPEAPAGPDAPGADPGAPDADPGAPAPDAGAPPAADAGQPAGPGG